ncbi:MAG: response regulator [Caldilineaceae bacterium]
MGRKSASPLMWPPAFSATIGGMMNAAPTPIRLLLVDDNAATRAATVPFLEETGPHPVSVLHAGDGQAAVELATQVDGDEVDVVLMDVQMPGWTASRRASSSCAPTSASSC